MPITTLTIHSAACDEDHAHLINTIISLCNAYGVIPDDITKSPINLFDNTQALTKPHNQLAFCRKHDVITLIPDLQQTVLAIDTINAIHHVK